MDRGAWWATVHGVTKSKDTTERLTLSYVNYRSIKLERERKKNKNTSLGEKKSVEEHFFVAYWFQARGKAASDS